MRNKSEKMRKGNGNGFGDRDGKTARPGAGASAVACDALEAEAACANCTIQIIKITRCVYASTCVHYIRSYL